MTPAKTSRNDGTGAHDSPKVIRALKEIKECLQIVVPGHLCSLKNTHKQKFLQALLRLCGIQLPISYATWGSHRDLRGTRPQK